MVYYLSPQKPMHLFSRTTNSFNTFADRNGPQILKCGGPLLPIPCCQLWGPWGPEYRAIRVLDDWCGWSTWPYDIGSYVDTLVDTLILVDISVDLGWEWAARLPKPGVCALLGKQFNYNMGTTLMWAWVQILHPQDWRNDRCSQWSNPMGQEDTTSTLSLTFPNQRDHPKLVGGFKHFSFFHILGMSSSQRTFIFFKLVKTSNQQTCGFPTEEATIRHGGFLGLWMFGRLVPLKFGQFGPHWNRIFSTCFSSTRSSASRLKQDG